jgi:hypothetical protein
VKAGWSAFPTDGYAPGKGPIEASDHTSNANDADKRIDTKEEVCGHGDDKKRETKKPLGV